jgi:hypothetical protein
MAAIWYLGPEGNLKELICPEVNIEMTNERFGGVFQGLSGARSMDVTGFKQKFTFEFNWLDQAEYQWYKALHLRQFPGPFRLLNPLEKNRLTPESSMTKWGGGTAQGFWMSGGVATRVWDYPATVGDGFGQSTKWSNRPAGTTILRFDTQRLTTVIPGETITASVWLKTNSAFSPNVVIDWWDRTTQTGSTAVSTPALTTSWQQVVITSVVPAGATRARFAMYTSNTTSELYMAAAQIESSATVTDWEIGGAAPIVFVDQMPTVSPRYPLRNVTMTLLEA